MSYISSKKIKVFPCSNRPDYIEDRWLTEYNLVNIINRLVDRDKFVVTTNWTSNDASEFMFNINGYLFKTTEITLIDKIKELGKSLSIDTTISYYLVATIITTPGVDSSPYLTPDLKANESADTGLDINNEFRGLKVEIYSQKQLPSNNSSLAILRFKLDMEENKEVKVENITIPIESKIKFETNQDGSRSVSIDDGELGQD